MMPCMRYGRFRIAWSFARLLDFLCPPGLKVVHSVPEGTGLQFVNGDCIYRSSANSQSEYSRP